MSDVIVVLGRGIESNGILPPDPQSRVRKAVELFNNGVAPLIIMSGSHSYHLSQPPLKREATAMKEYATSLGVPGNKIIEEITSQDTIGNVYFTKQLTKQNDLHSLTVIASDEHMDRVKYLFEKIFGPQYTFDFVASNKVLDDKRYAQEILHEQNSLAKTKEWLHSITPGDDESVWRLLTARHPAYKKTSEEVLL